jgi:hypothetical protein
MAVTNTAQISRLMRFIITSFVKVRKNKRIDQPGSTRKDEAGN